MKIKYRCPLSFCSSSSYACVDTSIGCKYVNMKYGKSRVIDVVPPPDYSDSLECVVEGSVTNPNGGDVAFINQIPTKELLREYHARVVCRNCEHGDPVRGYRKGEDWCLKCNHAQKTLKGVVTYFYQNFKPRNGGVK